jgi:peptidyl-prolyl cis-trans isomerase
MAKREYIEANKRWLGEKAKETGVKCLTKGVMYKVIKQGETGGASPSPRSIVTVHYTGRTINGRKFDSSLGGVPLKACRPRP